MDNRTCGLSGQPKEMVCIDTYRVLDSCRDKDCFEDVRVYLTCYGQEIIERTCAVRAKTAKVLWSNIDLNPVPFNRGFYQLSIKIYTKIMCEACIGPGNVQDFEGIAVVEKNVILFGSEGSVKVYTSDGEITTQADQPVGVVEAVDPIALSMQITEKDCATPLDRIPEVPASILAAFPEELVLTDSNRLWYATLGQFSLIRLERDSQLVIPVYNYCFPENECVGTTDDDPCTLFGRIRFPVEEFYPPDNLSTCDSYRSLLQ